MDLVSASSVFRLSIQWLKQQDNFKTDTMTEKVGDVLVFVFFDWTIIRIVDDIV